MSSPFCIRLLCRLGAVVLTTLVVTRTGILPAQELKEFDRHYLRPPAHGPDLRRAADEIIRRTNNFRYDHHLADVSQNDDLQKSAEYFAAYLARTDKFAHDADGNHPEDRAALSGYEYCIVAENIAWQMRSTGFSTKELARSFVESWKNSPPHRKNMLDPDVTETAVAVGYSPRTHRYYAVQEFGRPQSATLRFQVKNLTPETLHYTLQSANHENSAPQSIDLPPHTTMTHTRCRATTVDWEWTETDDELPARSDRAYVVKKAERGYEVTEKPIINPAPTASTTAESPPSQIVSPSPAPAQLR